MDARTYVGADGSGHAPARPPVGGVVRETHRYLRASTAPRVGHARDSTDFRSPLSEGTLSKTWELIHFFSSGSRSLFCIVKNFFGRPVSVGLIIGREGMLQNR